MNTRETERVVLNILRVAERDLAIVLKMRGHRELPPSKARLDNAQALLECLTEIREEYAKSDSDGVTPQVCVVNASVIGDRA